MIHCQHCGTDNLDGSEFCDECGMRLSTTASRINKVTPPLPPPPTFTTEQPKPKPAQPFVPPPVPPIPEPIAPPPVVEAEALPPLPEPVPVPIPEPVTVPRPDALQATTDAAIDSRQSSPNINSSGPSNAMSSEGTQVVDRSATQFMQAVKKPVSVNVSAAAKLVITRGGQIGKEFPLSGTEAMIGRWDADRGIFPDVDLDADDPEAKISRRHARIIVQGNRYFVEDLGSTNGTFVNRQQRLRPNQPYPLGNGDEIIVGKTFLKLVIN